MKFVAEKPEVAGMLKKDNKTLYRVKVKVNNAKYDELKEYVKGRRDKLRKTNPDASMGVAIKYKSVSVPLRGYMWKVSGDHMDMRTHYDYEEDQDNAGEIEEATIYFTF